MNVIKLIFTRIKTQSNRLKILLSKNTARVWEQEEAAAAFFI